MVNEFLEHPSVSTVATESITEDSSIGENVKDVTDSYSEIDLLMIELDSVIEAFLGASHVKDENEIGAKTLSKVWHIDCETAERTLHVHGQRYERKYNP